MGHWLTDRALLNDFQLRILSMNETKTVADLRGRLRKLLADPDRYASLPKLFELAVTLNEAGELEGALAAFEVVADALATREPGQLPVWQAIAGLRLQLGLSRGAHEVCSEASRCAPNHPDVPFSLGVVLAHIGDQRSAEIAYRRALALHPTHLGAALNLVGLLIADKRSAEALDVAADAINRHDSVADCWFNHGEALLSCAQTAEARESYARALELQPAMEKAVIAIAFCDAAAGDMASSSASFAAIAARSPGALAAYSSPFETDRKSFYPELEPGRIALISGYLQYRLCYWPDRARFVALFFRVLEGDGCKPLDNPDLPFLGTGLPLSSDVRQRMARQVAHRIEGEARRSFPPIRPERRHEGRIRVGYISGDFRRHATAFLAARLPALHDRDRFEVFLYSTGPDDGSDIRREIMDGSDHFCDLQRFDVAATAQRIAMDGIDILVDLSGYVLYARTAALALKPAPIVVNYLAYLQTMGAPWVDYAILDHTVLLPEERDFWDERIVYLPDTLYLCDDRSGVQALAHARGEYGLPEDRFVFCCLNAPWKIDPETFACWMSILRRRPESVLWLYDDTGLAAANLRAEAVRAGIDPARLIFTGNMPHEDHLLRFACADLFLDTFGCNAHTTCIEALAAGIPVLTLLGGSVVSRVAASLLRAHGVPELIMPDVETYIEQACAISADPAQLDMLRGKVKRRSQSALFCTQRRVRELERAYEMMWERHISGGVPIDFDVPCQID
jgi:tetratricopeptide (TPR) repeat protein